MTWADRAYRAATDHLAAGFPTDAVWREQYEVDQLTSARQKGELDLFGVLSEVRWGLYLATDGQNCAQERPRDALSGPQGPGRRSGRPPDSSPAESRTGPLSRLARHLHERRSA